MNEAVNTIGLVECLTLGDRLVAISSYAVWAIQESIDDCIIWPLREDPSKFKILFVIK